MSQTRTHRLSVATPSDREILLMRTFDAPRELVFDVMTDPAHIQKWWGCTDSTVTATADFRVGGAYRLEMKMSDGTDCPFKGVYREISRPGRVVMTQIFDVEPYNQFEAIVTLLLEEHEGQTTMTETILHATPEARDGHLNSGMKEGASISLDRLEDLLVTLQKGGQR